jgi:hypothetical protein
VSVSFCFRRERDLDLERERCSLGDLEDDLLAREWERERERERLRFLLKRSSCALCSLSSFGFKVKRTSSVFVLAFAFNPPSIFASNSEREFSES